MVKFFKPQKKEVSPKHFALSIIDADISGRGVARDGNGITWFVPGALPGEEVVVRAVSVKKNNIGEAELISVKKRSEQRISPKCPNTGCGGCSLQHISVELEKRFKADGIVRLMKKNLGIDPETPDDIVSGEEFGYRRTARLSVTGDRREIHLGFREEKGKNLVEIDSCCVLHPDLSDLIPVIREVLNEISNFKLIGHVELVRADNITAVMFRCINSLEPSDLKTLFNFGNKNGVAVYVQTRHEKGKEDLEDWEELDLLNEDILNGEKGLYYTIDDKRIYFVPGDFIQVNDEINRLMVSMVMNYLELNSEDRLLDLFCGLGNFTLPIASRCEHVYGIEGVWNMVKEAQVNAERNGIANAEFFVHDLTDDFEKTLWAKSKFNKVMLDPGRAGAEKVIGYLMKKKPETIVYVSCNPLTMIRDIREALSKGYKLSRWSVFDMFPKTEHVETVVLLSRDKA